MVPLDGEEAPPSWYAAPCVLGIDEAGRGPVLGAMVYGCAFCAVSEKTRISKLAYADSKTLSEEKREQLFEDIKADSSMGWLVDVIDPRDLSAQMLRREKRSLNAISHESAMGLIQQALDKGVNLKEVYVDTVGDPEKYAAWLTDRFPGIAMTVAKKADSLYPIVSAASIVAKVTRDRHLKAWALEESACETAQSFGSGYPADPETKEWLLKNVDPVFGFPSLVRFSWGTCKPIFEASCVDVAWEGDEEEEAPKKPKPKRSVCQSSAHARHGYFRTRQLQQVVTSL